MSVSRKCEDCFAVKRCRGYADPDRPTGCALTYLCRPCARALGYVPRPRRRGLAGPHTARQLADRGV